MRRIFAKLINKTKNDQLKELSVSPISLKDAKFMTIKQHYMKTWPKGVVVAFGLFYRKQCLGVMVYGYAPTTELKIKKFCHNIERNQYIELQRTWVSDRLGHNTESWFMARSMKIMEQNGFWIVLTHSGGCKDDVGFIFQASGWLYFGAKPCNDFYRTSKGEYKNLVSALRFGRVPKNISKLGMQESGEFLFGKGEIVHARRHLYLYPIRKSVRKRLSKLTEPFPKNPALFRKDQEWCDE